MSQGSSLPAIIAVGFMGLPVAAGLAGILAPAFGWMPALGGNELTLAPVSAMLSTPGLARSVMLSLASGLASALIAMLMTIALLASWSGTALMGWMQRLLSPLLSIPHAAVALGMAFLFAPSGWIMRLISPQMTGLTQPPDWLFPNDPFGLAMIVGLALKELPFLLLVSLAALPQTNPRANQQLAHSLGYGTVAGWLYATWPRLYRQIRLPIFAVIAYASSVVDVAIILGPTNPPPLAVQLVQWMHDPDLAMRFQASAGAVLQILVTACALVLWWLGERLCCAVFTRLVQSGCRFPKDRPLRLLGAALNGLAVAIMLASLAGLAVWSMAGLWRFPDALPQSLSSSNWQKHWPSVIGPLQNALVIGVLTAIIAILLTIALLEFEPQQKRGQRRRLLSSLIYLPLIVPQVAFLFGLQLIMLISDAGHSLGVVVLGHLVFVLPYCLLSLADPWRALDPRFAQQAAALGHGRWRVLWHIRLPLLLRPILTAIALGFAVSIGQYLPTILLGAGRWETITTEAVALSAGGDRRLIGVYALLQMGLPWVTFWLAMLIPSVLFASRADMKPVRG